jgi:hypothetical protein
MCREIDQIATAKLGLCGRSPDWVSSPGVAEGKLGLATGRSHGTGRESAFTELVLPHPVLSRSDAKRIMES